VKLRDVAKGTRAVRRVTLPLVNVPCDLLPDLPELAEQRARDREAWKAERSDQQPPDASVEVGLRVLNGDETVDVLERAREFAQARGSKDPKSGDPLYDFGEMVHRVVIAAVDPDSDPRNPEPFFASAEELLGSPHIGRDGIILLAEQQETWQDACSPQANNVTPGQLIEMIGRIATAETSDFFEQLRPGMRWICMRTLAALYLSSQTDRLSSGSTTEPATTSGSSKANAGATEQP